MRLAALDGRAARHPGWNEGRIRAQLEARSPPDTPPIHPPTPTPTPTHPHPPTHTHPPTYPHPHPPAQASFVNEAELVFTTLASSGRSVFDRLDHGFDLVLIDEAAQASEAAALVPLRHRARCVVLVGDPQQLPATVLSAAAREGLFQRSLFERLEQCGAQSLMLTVQYRMHPAIRQWPSDFFYEARPRFSRGGVLPAPTIVTPPPPASRDIPKPKTVPISARQHRRCFPRAAQGRLEDSKSVLDRQPEPHYADWPLLPYLVFDVSGAPRPRSGPRLLRPACRVRLSRPGMTELEPRSLRPAFPRSRARGAQRHRVRGERSGGGPGRLPPPEAPRLPPSRRPPRPRRRRVPLPRAARRPPRGAQAGARGGGGGGGGGRRHD